MYSQACIFWHISIEKLEFSLKIFTSVSKMENFQQLLSALLFLHWVSSANASSVWLSKWEIKWVEINCLSLNENTRLQWGNAFDFLRKWENAFECSHVKKFLLKGNRKKISLHDKRARLFHFTFMLHIVAFIFSLVYTKKTANKKKISDKRFGIALYQLANKSFRLRALYLVFLFSFVDFLVKMRWSFKAKLS